MLDYSFHSSLFQCEIFLTFEVYIYKILFSHLCLAFRLPFIPAPFFHLENNVMTFSKGISLLKSIHVMKTRSSLDGTS